MGQVTVSLNGRSYRLACDDGEEDRLRALADQVRQKLDAVTKEFGQVGDTRLMVMAALMLADDLLDAQPNTPPPGRGKSDQEISDPDGRSPTHPTRTIQQKTLRDARNSFKIMMIVGRGWFAGSRKTGPHGRLAAKGVL